MANSSYAASNPRVSKYDLYMILALWMDHFPDDEQREDPSHKKVGAVLVLPNDMSYAIDRSRDGVHAVARLIMAHPNIPEDCKVFVSRKPCSFCTKLLVQAKVERVFYLPIKPEYFPLPKELSEEDDTSYEGEQSCVDNMFNVSPIGQTIFVPKVGSEVVTYVQEKFNTPVATRDKIADSLMEKYWNPSSTFSPKEDLPWSSLDKIMEVEVKNDFKNMIKWMATFCVTQEKAYSFELWGERQHRPENDSFDPRKEKEQANYFMTLANFLAQRTDDPTTGVGAVIINKKMEIVGLGWNGFPKKALYGEFPRASDKDKDVPGKKNPYVIHAEQNALMMRNTKNIEGGTLFVTKTPCNDCTTLLEMQGIKTVVLGKKYEKEAKPRKRYTKFPDAVDSGKFIFFFMKSNEDDIKRKLDNESENEEKPGTSSKMMRLEDNQ